MEEKRFSGGCACGAVRYECVGEPALVAHCHCRDCQRASGAGASTVFGMPRSGFRPLQGQTATFSTTGDTGNPVVRHFCPSCGSPLYSEVAVVPELQFIRVVSLDEPAALTPTMHIYCDSAQPWDLPGDGLPRFGRMPG